MNYFLAQALNNQWANLRLFEACSYLSDAEFVAQRTSFFPSIQRTLCHILDVDLYYLAALEEDREGQTQDFAKDAAFTQLAERQASIDQRLVAFCESLTEQDLSRTVDLVRTEGVVLERIDRLLLHLFEHQIHHRGQVHSMLSATQVKPPQLDEFFLECDRPFREKEERELLLSEARVWRDYRSA
ncbi:MAG: damage-inducible protein DinB [Pseudomonas sp.]|nr:damage-inducible protein DinB [Pseudomonas sp.]